jgi:hypothetical protein
MKKRHSNPGRAARWLFTGDHLTEEALLRSLDGEISAREADDVDGHVQSCWSCRSRRQAIGHGIADLFEYQNAVIAPYLPPPADQRSVFLARLDALAAEMGRPSRLEAWFNGAKRLLSPRERSQFAWIAGILALLALIPVAYFLRSSGTVTAAELLSRARDSEIISLQSTAEPVVVQKLRISVGRKSLTRTVYRDVGHHRAASRTDSSADESLVKAAYSKSLLDWNSPLDAETYSRWRASLPVQSDRVVQLGNDQLTLKTTYSAGAVAETDLTLRTADYHAVKERLRLQDNSEIEIAELSYDVIPFASAPSDIFGRPTLPAAVLPPAVVIPRSVQPGSAVLAAVEVEAEVALHGLGADLGEQIKISDHVGREVLIEGVVADDARKQQLLSALQDIPHTRLRIVTIDEAAQQSSPPPIANHGSRAASSIQQLVATPPLLDAQLNARFPDKDQRIAYVNQTLSLAQVASARAWALNRLADRHPLQEVAVLNEDARRQLQVLLTDHVSALREDISSLQNQLGEILSHSSNTPAANTSVKASLESVSTDASDSSDDWRDRIRRIHSSTEAIHEAVVVLLSSSQPSDQKDGDAIEVNLRTSLTQLQTELQTLDQRVHETNLK